MWSCKQSLVTLACLWEKYHNLNFVRTWPRKTIFLSGALGSSLINLGLALDMALKFYSSVAKVLKLKVKKVFGLILTFVEATGKKLVRGTPILNRVKTRVKIKSFSMKNSNKCCKLIFQKSYHKLGEKIKGGNFPKFVYYLSHEREQN